MKYFKDFCPNCSVYGWKQPSDESELLRCSRCKFISYCSKECQEEHWIKVHSRHCKYLAKKKVMRKNMHDPATCPGCMKQAEIGLTEMSEADNPYLGCPWTVNNVLRLPKPKHRNVGGEEVAVPLPFKLGEMSGQWQTKAEHKVSIMNSLLHKLKVTKHPAYTSNPVASNLMVKLVNNMRQVIWLAYIHYVPTSLDRNIAGLIQPAVTKIIKQAEDINKELSAQKFKDQTVFRPWDTFRLILYILFKYTLDRERQDAVRLGLPGIPEDDKQLMVTSDLFNETWRKVLDSMNGILLPYTDLLKILCDGDLHQVCSVCSHDIVVSDVASNDCGVPYIFQGAITQAYLCGEVECQNKVDTRDDQIFETCMKTSGAAKENHCDYCFLVSSGKVHRCTRCLTKYYCGLECRDEDWGEVHKLVCKGGQERKIKGGQEERKEKGIEKVEEIDNFFERLNFNVE